MDNYTKLLLHTPACKYEESKNNGLETWCNKHHQFLSAQTCIKCQDDEG